MNTPKYLYLTHPEWVEAWVRGGQVPIKLASSYVRDQRTGIFTPDEGRIHEAPVDMTNFTGMKIDKDANIKGLTITNCAVNGVPLPNLVNASYYSEDGIILSFCNRKSRAIADRLGKSACVRIDDIYMLKNELDSQLKKVGEMRPCEYTKDHRRNHFLKSEDDAWQDEFRIFWPFEEMKYVVIRPGTGSEETI